MKEARRNRALKGLLCLLLVAAAAGWLVACGGGGSSSDDSSSGTSAQPGTWDQMVWGESTWG